MSEEKFVQIHNHSHFSLLDGLMPVEDLVKCASDLGYKSLALTDHGTCGGLLKFQNACKKAKIKPILGMEAYITADRFKKDKETTTYHLVLLAKNKIGYDNLIKLSSLGYLEGFYSKPRIDFDLLQKHKDGLIVTSACIGGEIPQAFVNGEDSRASEIASKYKEVFGDDFYIEIMTHKYFTDKEQEEREKKVANQLYKLAKALNIKAIATCDTHYARKEDWEAHDVLLSIQTIRVIKDPDRFTFDSDDFYLKSIPEMEQIYKRPELLTNTVEIANKIESCEIIEESKDLLPLVEVPEGFASDEAYLKALIVDGMKAKGFFHKQEYRDRVKMEMEVIKKCGYLRYFLILWDIMNFARKEKVRYGLGRGSGAGSLCLYVLNITGVDPLKYGLLFERFLNPERISPPDVDIDFDYNRRQEVYDYIVRKYGKDYCSQIGTYNGFKGRAAIKGTAKALDIGKDWEKYLEAKSKDPSAKVEMTKNSLFLADTMSKEIPIKINTVEEAYKKVPRFRMLADRYAGLIKNAMKVEGALASTGVHPAGIIVCRYPIVDKVPLKLSKGAVCSQFEGGEVEKLGLLKFDLLALKTLTVIDKTIKMVESRHGALRDKDGNVVNIDTLEPDDTEIFNIMSGRNSKINTCGIFQFEGDKISDLLRNMGVDQFDDMVVVNALYRPGPLQAGVHTLYCDYKHGRKPLVYAHPAMEEILSSTYGLLIYQESIMKLCQRMAGFSLGQADLMRKAIGKKLPEVLAEQKPKFIEGCMKNGVSRDVAEKVFKDIDYFSGYGFNKCLSGSTLVKNKLDDKEYSLEYLCKNKDVRVVLDSYLDGKVVEDDVVEVFETGDKELFEVVLDNGMKLECSMDHKFYCIDGQKHTLKDIVDQGLEILCDSCLENGMQKCKVTSARSLGSKKTYNVTMASDQHNYRIVDKGKGVYSANSHSVCYAFIGYQTCWLKRYYPIEFMCSLLTAELNNNDKDEKLHVYQRQAEAMGFACMPENINRSGLEYRIEPGKHKKDGRDVLFLRKPLNGLKGVGTKAVENIVLNQPYNDLTDFLSKVDTRVVNSRVFKTLLAAGCMDGWGVDKDTLLESYEGVKKELDKKRKQKKKAEELKSGMFINDEDASSDDEEENFDCIKKEEE